MQCDEIWSFAGSKERKVWVLLAIDRDLRKIAGAYAGSRNKAGALGLWNALHESCKEHAVFYSDFWPACKEVFPQSGIFLSERTAAKQVILNGSI